MIGRALKWHGFAGAMAAAIAIASIQSCSSEERVRVVLITLDTLRFDAFASSSGQPSAMPLLEQRAKQGANFIHFHTAGPLTQPSHASMFTGLHPWQHGVTRNGQVMSESIETIAEKLRLAGFSTQAVVASFPVAGRFGFGQGFDRYVEEFTDDFMELSTWEGQTLPSSDFYAKAETVTRNALEAIDAATGPRQFFWFHYFDPHAPYGSSLGMNVTKRSIYTDLRRNPDLKNELLETVRALYREDVAHLDRSLDEVLERLEADGARFRTHIVIVADHGESLGEGESLGHGTRLDEVELRVPALILSPDVVPGLRDDTAGSVDVAATLLGLAGLDVPESIMGRDLRTRPESATAAFGMRRTFAVTPASELRLDGLDHPMPDFEFYMVSGAGPYIVGNAEGVTSGGSGNTDDVEVLFDSFERALSARPTTRIPDDVAEALEALGYAP